jgi:hypothetical protein
MKINLEKAETSAQAVTTVCYNENTRNLNFRITCENLNDLKESVKIIDQYNDFNWETINEALDQYVSFKRFYNDENPNNGTDLLTFDIGRESSPVMYVKYFEPQGNKYRTENNEVRDFTKEDFEKSLRAFANIAKADECDFGNDGCYSYCRLWWD